MDKTTKTTKTPDKAAKDSAPKPDALPTVEAVQKAVLHAQEVGGDALAGIETFQAYTARISGYETTARGSDAAAYRASGDVRAKTPQMNAALDRYTALHSLCKQNGLLDVKHGEYLEMGYSAEAAQQFVRVGLSPAQAAAARDGSLARATANAKRKATLAAKD